MAQFEVKVKIMREHIYTVDVQAESEDVAKKEAIEHLSHDAFIVEDVCEDIGEWKIEVRLNEE